MAATTLLDTGKSCHADALADGLYLVINASDKPAGLGAGAGLMEVQVYWGRYVTQRLSGLNPGAQWVRMIDNTNSADVPWQPQVVASGVSNTTLLTMGDSITMMYAYQPQLSVRLGSTNVLNGGIAGTRFANIGDHGELSLCRLVDAKCDNSWASVDAAVAALLAQGADFRTIVNRIKAADFSTLPYLTAFFGTNDFYYSTPLGAPGDDNKTTFYGAINYSVRRLSSTFPSVRPFFITPMFMGALDGHTGTIDPDTTANAGGLYLRDYVDALANRCGTLGVPVLDLYRKSGINKFNAGSRLTDGIHPTVASGIELGNKIGAWLASSL